jgi:hypothetical protein
MRLWFGRVAHWRAIIRAMSGPGRRSSVRCRWGGGHTEGHHHQSEQRNNLQEIAMHRRHIGAQVWTGNERCDEPLALPGLSVRQMSFPPVPDISLGARISSHVCLIGRHVSRQTRGSLALLASKSIYAEAITGHRYGPEGIALDKRIGLAFLCRQPREIEKGYEMVRGRDRQAVIRVVSDGEDVRRAISHLSNDGVVEPLCPIECRVWFPPLNTPEMMDDVAAGNDHHTLITKSRELRTKLHMVFERL